MSVPRSVSLQTLEQGFRVFNHVSEQLAESYHQLEHRVARLDDSLRAQVAAGLLPNSSLVDADRLARILNALPAGVVVIDGAGRVLEHNALAERLLGVALRGQVWRQVAARVFAPQSDDGHDISLRNGRKLSLSTCPLGSEPGQIMLLSDVTETRRLQEHLNQLQRLGTLGEMAAGLAHQIRTPLAAGLLYASQLKNSRLTGEQQSQAVAKLMAQLAQLENLVNDMLLFAKRRYAGDEGVTIPSLLQELKQSMQSLVESQSIEFSVECPVLQDGVVLGNPRVLLSALQNLVTNASQATGPGGRIAIRVEQELSNAVDIHISDNGTGIPEDLRARIFDPFVTTRANGTGLGLAVVRAVVQAHNGEVWLADSGPEGTRFVLRLPLSITKKASSNTYTTSQQAETSVAVRRSQYSGEVS